MNELMWFVMGAAVLCLLLGFFVGHYHATQQWKDFVSQVRPGLQSDLSGAEQELVKVFRKVTGKDPGAAPAGGGSAPSSDTAAGSKP